MSVFIASLFALAIASFFHNVRNFAFEYLFDADYRESKESKAIIKLFEDKEKEKAKEVKAKKGETPECELEDNVMQSEIPEKWDHNKTIIWDVSYEVFHLDQKKKITTTEFIINE